MVVAEHTATREVVSPKLIGPAHLLAADVGSMGHEGEVEGRRQAGRVAPTGGKWGKAAGTGRMAHTGDESDVRSG